MPGTRLQSHTDEEVFELKRRVRRLEGLVRQVIETRIMPTPFSFSGVLVDAVGIESPPWRPLHPISVDLLVPQVLVAPAGGDLTIDIFQYGPVAGFVTTLTIPDGLTYVEVASPFTLGIGASLTATITNDASAESLAIAALPRLL